MGAATLNPRLPIIMQIRGSNKGASQYRSFATPSGVFNGALGDGPKDFLSPKCLKRRLTGSSFSGKSLNLLPQMSDFKAKMHQIQFRLRFRPRTRWGSLQLCPRPLAIGLYLRNEIRYRGLHKRASALTITRGPLYRPIMSWTLIHKRCKTRPAFLLTLSKFCILLHCQAWQTEISKRNSTKRFHSGW